MKTIVLTCVLACFAVSFSRAQQSTRYRKIMENNCRDDFEFSEGYGTGIPRDSYNMESKTPVERLFFGDRNAEVEYFFLPSFDGASGLRLVKDACGGYVLETKRVTNWQEVERQIVEEFPPKGYATVEELMADVERSKNLSEEEREREAVENAAMNDRLRRERHRRWTIRTCSVPVSGACAGKLYERIASAIDGFTMKGRPAVIGDGYDVTFRCVVGDELRTLTVQNPDAESVRRLSDLCRRMIADIEAGRFDERECLAGESGSGDGK